MILDVLKAQIKYEVFAIYNSILTTFRIYYSSSSNKSEPNIILDGKFFTKNRNFAKRAFRNFAKLKDARRYISKTKK